MLKWVSKSGTIMQFAIFTVILVATWIPAFMHPLFPVQTSSDGPLYVLLAGWMKPYPTLNVTSALLLVVIQALILFYVYQANGFFKRSNFLPAIIILLAYSWNSNYQTMHALLPAGIMIIMALNSIIRMYGQPAAHHQVFTASFAIGIASLFYIPLAYLLLLVWFTLITYRVSSWREYTVSIVGFSLPLIYYLSWLFWNDNLPSGLHQLSDILFNVILPPRLSFVNMAWLWISGFILVVTMVAVLNIMNDKLISLRRRSWVLFNLSFTVVIMMIFAGWPMLSANYLYVAPISFFITGSLSLSKQRFWFEVLATGYLILFIAMKVYMVVI